MKLAVLLATAALAAAPSVFAADVLKADVPFPFQVESKTLPAGAYEFKIDIPTDTVEVRGGTPRAGAVALITTRLAARPHAEPQEHGHIVFDKVGSTYTLSELWEPSTDGFLLHLTKGKHEHEVIHLTK